MKAIPRRVFAGRRKGSRGAGDDESTTLRHKARTGLLVKRVPLSVTCLGRMTGLGFTFKHVLDLAAAEEPKGK